MAVYQEMPFHEGELSMHQSLHVAQRPNPTVSQLSPQLANHIQVAPLIALGTLDLDGKPWTTIIGGTDGLGRAVNSEYLGMAAPASPAFDPVLESLVSDDSKAAPRQGRMVSGLTIDLMTQKRVKFFGRLMGASLKRNGDIADDRSQYQGTTAELQMILRIEQSLGNCPKYLNKKQIIPKLAHPVKLSESRKLCDKALALIEKADLFFITSKHENHDMDTNHRGGPDGFLRVLSNDSSSTAICWPEYSGNLLYQTLGNLKVSPEAGLCIPDFETGDVLYLTGTTKILIGKDTADYISRSNLAVVFTVTEARLIEQGLPFRGVSVEKSPYNPPVRYLTSEKNEPSQLNEAEQHEATLVLQSMLTPSISRFRFSLDREAQYTAGQYATFDFSEHLDLGYSHMRDDDPSSLNDDFIRTFTVSSHPTRVAHGAEPLKNNEFEVTVRKVGKATGLLFKHGLNHSGDRLKIGFRGFGGEFVIKQETDQTIAFVAAGVGITPLMPFLDILDMSRLHIFWSIKQSDLGLVNDLAKRHPQLLSRLRLFTNGDHDEVLRQIRDSVALQYDVQFRRMHKADLVSEDGVSTFYLCTPVPMRKQILEWLPEKNVVFEDFNF